MPASRRSQLSGEAYGPEQRIPLMEALKTFTINGAYLTYDDDVRGSLAEGKLADFVILDADLLTASEEELLQMGSKVLMTVVGGQPVFAREGFALS